MKYNKRITAKERGLIKGALRRVFSRSDLRQQAMKKALVTDYIDPKRPRVTKWGRCSSCNQMEPLYKMQVDHEEPVVKVDSSLEEMTADELVDGLWCDERLLKPVCQPCHKEKTKAENKERRRIKKEKKSKCE